jgi:hypothetical protein
VDRTRLDGTRWLRSLIVVVSFFAWTNDGQADQCNDGHVSTIPGAGYVHWCLPHSFSGFSAGYDFFIPVDGRYGTAGDPLQWCEIDTSYPNNQVVSFGYASVEQHFRNLWHHCAVNGTCDPNGIVECHVYDPNQPDVVDAQEFASTWE